MISFDEAQRLLTEASQLLSPTVQSTNDSTDQVLSSAVSVQEDVPRFDNSAMDGYAVRREDLAEASPDDPIELRETFEVAAGDSTDEESALRPGETARIFTGAPVPAEADAVVKQEDVNVVEDNPNRIQFCQQPEEQLNIRHRGEELRTDDTLVESRTICSPATIGLLLGQGITEVSVYPCPNISVLSTGDELVNPSEKPGPGQIRESNGPAIKSLMQPWAGDVNVERAGDRPEEIRQLISSSFEKSDIIIITGGVSVGEHDYTKQVLGEMNVETVFWKVRQKPGKPIYFGQQDETYVLGLPGNPVSCLVCCYLYGIPLARGLMGYPEEDRLLRTGKSSLRQTIDNHRKRPVFARARTHDEDNGYESELMEAQGSHMLSGQVQANSLVRIPPETNVSPSDLVEVYFLPDV